MWQQADEAFFMSSLSSFCVTEWFSLLPTLDVASWIKHRLDLMTSSKIHAHRLLQVRCCCRLYQKICHSSFRRQRFALHRSSKGWVGGGSCCLAAWTGVLKCREVNNFLEFFPTNFFHIHLARDPTLPTLVRTTWRWELIVKVFGVLVIKFQGNLQGEWESHIKLGIPK